MKPSAITTYCKRCIKTASPRLWDLIVRVMFSEHVWTLRTLHKRKTENRQITANLPYLAVNMNSRMGMGAQMSWTAILLAYCEDHGFTPRLIFTNPLYAQAPGVDWLDTFFERHGPLLEESSRTPPAESLYVPESVHLKRRMKATLAALSLERLHKVLFSALRFRHELVEQVEDFCNTNQIGLQTIGVHFRGTDKRQEATRASWNDIASAVKANWRPGESNIFVATDEPEFLAFMREQFNLDNVIDLDCQEIFSGTPAHLTPGNSYTKGSEAIRTMLVLSRCGLLIRSRSHLSAWAKILSPSLPTIVLGEMLGGDLHVFPENLIETDACFKAAGL